LVVAAAARASTVVLSTGVGRRVLGGCAWRKASGKGGQEMGQLGVPHFLAVVLPRSSRGERTQPSFVRRLAQRTMFNGLLSRQPALIDRVCHTPQEVLHRPRERPLAEPRAGRGPGVVEFELGRRRKGFQFGAFKGCPAGEDLEAGNLPTAGGDRGQRRQEKDRCIGVSGSRQQKVDVRQATRRRTSARRAPLRRPGSRSGTRASPMRSS
jgi:hypothetical protein